MMKTFTRLQCENMDSPRGVDVAAPRLSWQGEPATVTLYQGDDAVWQSAGAVASGVRIDAGLAPRTVYRWELADGAAAASFETGRGALPWQAQWIFDPEHPGKIMAPVSCFECDFTLEKPIVKARLYATALGVYKSSVNGEATSDACLAPGFTDYCTRVNYQVDAVENLLRPGANTLQLLLADGWYAGMISRCGADYTEPFYKSVPAVLAQLEITFADGSEKIVATSGDWRVSNTGAWRWSDIYMGECRDARCTWGTWRRAAERTEHVRITGADAPCVRRIGTIAPVQTWPLAADRTLVDFGQNLVGRERLRFTAAPGTRVTVRHGEARTPDGGLYTENLRAARAETLFIAGDGELTLEPEFTFYGFRYLEITGIAEFEVTAQILAAPMATTGAFTCSNADLNRLFLNIQWGQRGNFVDIPTDCPQRDERRGWLGDAQVFMRAALYNMDAAAFFRKWLVDVDSCRDAAGRYAQFVPCRRNGPPIGYGVSGWADAGIICPWRLYEFYGDAGILAAHYAPMCGWVDWQERHSDRLICCHARFKDWLSLDAETDEKLISTAYFAYDLQLMARIAAALGKNADAATFAARFAAVREAFAARFLDAENELVVRTQCAAVLALAFELLPSPDATRRALAWLTGDIEARDCHLATGFLGTPHLLHVLSDHGATELAYRLLERTTCPSWLYPVTQGATTVWERWNSWSADTGFGDPAMNSFNHYAYGAVADWIYMNIGGIRPAAPGFRKITLAPRPGGTLRHAAVRFDAPVGPICSAWRRENGRIRYTFTVPAGATAQLCLPGGFQTELAPGEHEFTEPTEA